MREGTARRRVRRAAGRKFVGLLYGALLGVVACAGGAGGAADAGDTTVRAAGISPGAEAPRPRRIILFAGTSLTAGLGLEADQTYPALLQLKLDSARVGYEVVNAGVSGETSSALLRRMEWLLQQPFDWIVIETGANDGLRGVPVETMRANLERIVERVRAARPSARIALAQMEAPPNLGPAYTRRFRDAFREVAREANVQLLPFLLDGVAGASDMNQGDGIHPNQAGSRRVAENIWKALSPVLD